MRIGIDIDDTVTNTWEYVLPMHAERFGKGIEELKKGRPYFEAVSDCVSSFQEYSLVMNDIYKKYKEVLPLKENAVKNINKLYDMGHSIYFITSRSVTDDEYEATKRFLDNNNFKYNKLFVGVLNKADMCLKLGIDLFIDDSLKQCREVSNMGIRTLMFYNTFNRGNDFTYLMSWDDIFKFVK